MTGSQGISRRQVLTIAAGAAGASVIGMVHGGDVHGGDDHGARSADFIGSDVRANRVEGRRLDAEACLRSIKAAQYETIHGC